MGDQFWSQVSIVLIAIVGVATLAVVLSKNSNTSNVIQAAGKGLSQALGAALSPVAGNSALNF